jgi:hypothetical protein
MNTLGGEDRHGNAVNSGFKIETTQRSFVQLQVYVPPYVNRMWMNLAALAQTAQERGIDPQSMPAEDRVATLARAKALAVAQSFAEVAQNGA